MSTYRYPGTGVGDYKKEIILTLMVILVIVGCVLVGTKIAANSFQRRAVESGHAEYYLDNNHERQWRWKEIK